MSSGPTFQQEALPQDIEPYRQEAKKQEREAFEKIVPYPFLLYVRSQLWDKSIVFSQQMDGDPGATCMAKYEYYEGGHTFLHPVRKRQTDPRNPGIILGRSTQQDIIVPVSSVSNMHLTFFPPLPNERLWTIVDNGSSNGTWINDDKLYPHVRRSIQDGEYLRLGGNLIAWFLYPGHLWQILLNPAELKKLTDV